jgi:hypothetical protein
MVSNIYGHSTLSKICGNGGEAFLLNIYDYLYIVALKHLARMGEESGGYGVLVGKTDGK